MWTLRCARAAPLRVSTAPAHSGAAPALRAGGLRPASAGSVQRNMVGFLLPHRLQPFEPCSREPRNVGFPRILDGKSVLPPGMQR